MLRSVQSVEVHIFWAGSRWGRGIRVQGLTGNDTGLDPNGTPLPLV